MQIFKVQALPRLALQVGLAGCLACTAHSVLNSQDLLFQLLLAGKRLRSILHACLPSGQTWAWLAACASVSQAQAQMLASAAKPCQHLATRRQHTACSSRRPLRTAASAVACWCWHRHRRKGRLIFA